MKISVFLPTVTLLLMFLIEEGLGLQCHVCNSFLSESCAGALTMESDTLTTCTNGTACRKIEQEVYYDEQYDTRIIRQCGYEENPPLTCISRSGTYRYKVQYCHCNEDGCNSAVTSTISVTMLFLALGLAHFAMKHL
ncbi:uncharacterized protein LOC124277166 [Haliotis rubra]|uniref:uncharacterized protein LOC124277166 n=1 Tax=Haliotis rubra TaxID=36100 RepID=UPI001EE62914|nr:uncharacterized protein LOC124277166 [Haliotis rubra]